MDTQTTTKKRTPNQIPLTFKNNKEEKQLYAWLKGKLSSGTYIKEILYREFLIETGRLKQVPQPEQQLIKDNPPRVESSKTKIGKNNFNFSDEDE